jgi:hypothetical protein
MKSGSEVLDAKGRRETVYELISIEECAPTKPGLCNNEIIARPCPAISDYSRTGHFVLRCYAIALLRADEKPINANSSNSDVRTE